MGIRDWEVIGLYYAHGECEQFHSEIKIDMDLERLPFGKFETNELVLELAILVYNILRMIRQESCGRRGKATKHKLRRRRLRTVIGNMIMMVDHVTEHARQMLLGLGRNNIWRYAFAEVYIAFADFRLLILSCHFSLKCPRGKYAHRKESPAFLTVIGSQKLSKYIKLLPLEGSLLKVG